MKKILLLASILLISQLSFCQINHIVEYSKWSDPTTFNISPSPIIKGYGYYSDSLSNIFEGKIFYEHNEEYYCIENWADYYYWFTQEYSYKFNDPQLYEYYYWAGDNFGMASYIAGINYLGKYYPSLITLSFADLTVKNNKLIDDRYFAKSDKKIKKFNKELIYSKSDKKNASSNSRIKSAKIKPHKTIKNDPILQKKIHTIDNKLKGKVTPLKPAVSSKK